MLRNSKTKPVSGSVVPLGFILVVTVVALALVAFQSTTIPAMSEEAEVDAHHDVETDFIKMDSSIYRAATTGVPQPVVMGNRVKYPPHLNPLKTPTPYLRTDGPYDLRINNSVYVNNSTQFKDVRATNSILFSRDYNYYTTSRAFGYEHGIFYTQKMDAKPGDSSILARDKQTLINGKSVSIIAIQGEVSFSRPSPTQISVYPKSGQERHETITNQAGEEVTLTIPTRLPESTWRDLLEPELMANGGHVAGISYSTTNPQTGSEDGVNYLIVTLEGGIEYDVNLYTVKVEKF